MPEPMPEILVGDTVHTERGHQFKVREIRPVQPDRAQGASWNYLGRHGQSALDVAVVRVVRTVWRREEPIR